MCRKKVCLWLSLLLYYAWFVCCFHSGHFWASIWTHLLLGNH
jgi:hypothetical protein